ncbi:hypothetical protein DUNSADRAFT_237 [Dunaliella salina]|uniref:Uncharacterized protein n=1 Tax=Dunaliella salina TaxID=3046 RepID=A0ABQ7GYL3_DUNSA|nr:hypothetical protein DUNSADRAFT_237 [Dunaliella salina]KAF5839687.1 hypothetical protein DUNSADRAFT_237 [Dunaliella salina]|eukprot:KAF5839686.1 hypothetical protein DUNSADRAFT_237 [Dunaliella salina]
MTVSDYDKPAIVSCTAQGFMCSLNNDLDFTNRFPFTCKLLEVQVSFQGDCKYTSLQSTKI